MASPSNWRSSLGAVGRYENIDKLRKGIEAKGLSSTGASHKAAIAAEAEAYNTSQSREAYDAACKAIIDAEAIQDQLSPAQDVFGPPTTIGSFENCHHIASGLASEVYRCKTVALKVITETHNIEPHNPDREVKILQQVSHRNVIRLTETFRDQEQRLVMVFPFIPLTLAKLIGSGSISSDVLKKCFQGLFSALSYLHHHGIIHRDVKPSNLLLASLTGPAYLSDFGTAWHPNLSTNEPADQKCLEVGTTCYRAPETLFGNRSYGTTLDMWSAGVMLAECVRKPPKALFESRDTSEDGNQLGLILSIFKTIGTPTKRSWPEALGFSTPPFEWYQEFPGESWDGLLPGVDDISKDLVKKLVLYESGHRLTASEALEHLYFTSIKEAELGL